MDLSFLTPYLSVTGTVLLVTAMVLVAIVCWGLTLLGLPGNWMLVLTAIAYDFVLENGSRLEISWPVIIGLIVLATLGEGLEFLAGVIGVRRTGGSKLSAVLALVGSIIGGVVGGILGVPIPLIGPFVGVLLFAGVGALAGAALGEDWHGEDLNRSLQVGMAAFWGRLLGSLAKTLVGGMMVAAMIAAIFI